MRQLFQFFRPHRPALVLIVLASALEMFFNAQIPMSVKFLIDRSLLGHDRRMMLVILGALAASTLIVSVSSLGRDYLYAKTVARIISSLRGRMFEHLQRLSMEFYSRHEAADVMSRFSNDVGTVETGLAAGVAWGLQPLLDLLLSTVLVFSLEWRLATLGVMLCPLCVLGPRLLSREATAASTVKQEHQSGLLTEVQEAISAPALVKAFGLEKTLVAKFRRRDSMLVGASLRLGFLSSLMERSASFGTLLLQAVIMGVSGWLAFRGTITVGTFAAFQTLFISLSYSFMYLAQYTPNLISARGGLTRIEEVLHEEPSVADAPGAPDLKLFSQALEMRDVTFGYSRDQKNLDSVSLRIPKGESVAFVGPSGSGKSTVLNLLLRFYDPDAGSVIFDGTDLREARQASLHAQTGVVFQENFLFNATVRENIAVSRPEATDYEIIAAAQAAEIHDVIAALPDGYETVAGERGRRFSGGQRQRIAIARALLCNPAILILDEATSALDAASEHAINGTIARIAKGRTVISVTHRLSAVAGMNRIFVLDRGRLIEEGTHNELLARRGLYANLWRKQAGVAVEANETRATVDSTWLAELSLMQGVSRAALESMALSFGTEIFPAGRDIVHQGDPGDRFYIVARGTVEVSREENRHKTILAKLTDGDCFGEMALLSDSPRNATVRTLTHCICLSLSRDVFKRVLATEPELREHIQKVSAARSAL